MVLGTLCSQKANAWRYCPLYLNQLYLFMSPQPTGSGIHGATNLALPTAEDPCVWTCAQPSPGGKRCQPETLGNRSKWEDEDPDRNLEAAQRPLQLQTKPMYTGSSQLDVLAIFLKDYAMVNFLLTRVVMEVNGALVPWLNSSISWNTGFQLMFPDQQ